MVKLGYFLSFLLVLFQFFSAQVAVADSRPNIILLIADDQHWNDLYSVMPNTVEKIFNSGVTFSNAYITTPICCPSRASILTGKYATQHGVLSNSYPLKEPTIIAELKKSGYYTGIIGKYLNSWNGKYRPEFDYWRVFKGGNADYINPEFNENGKWVKQTGHIAQVTNEYINNFFKQAKPPFILLVTPQIPHRPAIPEDKYRNLFKDYEGYASANAGCDKRKGKPRWIRAAPCQPRVRQNHQASSKKDKFQIRQRQTLKSFDDIVLNTLNHIDRSNLKHNTAVFYLSDNGLLRRSFGLIGKMYQYEDSIKVPFAFNYPKLKIARDSKIENLVANIDITPTIRDLAKLTSSKLPGQSLIPLIEKKSINWRSELLIESQFRGKLDGVKRTAFAGLRTERYAFFVNRFDFPELYDMQRDPDQLNNIVLKKIKVARDLFSKLQKLRPDISNRIWFSGRYRRYF